MKVLVFAPHPDDEILGCGGTMARHIAEGNEVDVCIVTRGKPPLYQIEKEIYDKWPHNLYPEISRSHALLGISHTYFLELPAAMMEDIPRYELNGKISEIIIECKPDIIYMPHFGDMQKDHALTSQAIMVAVRPKYENVVQYVYAYETLSETEWNIPHVSNIFVPNVFVDISDYLPKKLEAMECYQSQICDFPDPRSLDAVESLAKLRGSTMGAKAAEAFMLIREYRYK